MIKSEELRNPESCLNRAQAHEPLFVLLGRDASAAAAVRAWIADRVAKGKNKPEDPQIKDAEFMAGVMEAYHAARNPKSALNPAAAWPFHDSTQRTP